MFETGRFFPGGPTLYSESNRTAAWLDQKLFQTCLIFIVIYLGFLVTLPIVRRKRIVTWALVTFLLFQGLMLFIGLQYPEWELGSVDIETKTGGSYVAAKLTVKLGLDQANITMIDVKNKSFYYNEIIRYTDYPQRQYTKEFLTRGLPNEILTVINYMSPISYNYNMMSVGPNGLEFMPYCISAGYLARALMYYSVALWLFTFFAFLAIPVYAHYVWGFTGLTILGSVLAFTASAQVERIAIYVNGSFLILHYGWVYYTLLGVGTVCVVCCFGLFVYQDLLKKRFITTIELDYDTPYYWENVAQKDFAKFSTEKDIKYSEFMDDESIFMKPLGNAKSARSSRRSKPECLVQNLPESKV